MSNFEYDDAMTPTGTCLERGALSPGRRDRTRAAMAQAHRAMIQRLVGRAATVLAAGAAVAAILALKTAIFLWRFDY